MQALEVMASARLRMRSGEDLEHHLGALRKSGLCLFLDNDFISSKQGDAGGCVRKIILICRRCGRPEWAGGKEVILTHSLS